MPKKHGNFSPKEKAQIALLAIKGEKTMAQISSDYHVYLTQIGLWKKYALENLSRLFQDNRRKEKKKEEERREELDNLYKLIGQKDLELDWLKKKLSIDP